MWKKKRNKRDEQTQAAEPSPRRVRESKQKLQNRQTKPIINQCCNFSIIPHSSPSRFARHRRASFSFELVFLLFSSKALSSVWWQPGDRISLRPKLQPGGSKCRCPKRPQLLPARTRPLHAWLATRLHEHIHFSLVPACLSHTCLEALHLTTHNFVILLQIISLFIYCWSKLHASYKARR